MKAVLQLFESYAKAERTVEALRNAGFADSDMSLLRSEPGGTLVDRGDLEPNRDSSAIEQAVGAIEARDPSGNRTTLDAMQGSMLGGLAGTLAGLGVLAIPGFGPILAAAAGASVVSGGAVGAGLGGAIGRLAGHKLSDSDARDYEAGIERGALLLILAVPVERELEARALLDSVDARSLIEHRQRWENNPAYRYDLDTGWLDMTDTAVE